MVQWEIVVELRVPPLKRELLCKQGITNSEGARSPRPRRQGREAPVSGSYRKPTCVHPGRGAYYYYERLAQA